MSRTETLMVLNVAHFFDHFFLLIFPTAAIAIAVDWDMTYAAVFAMGTPVYVMLAISTFPAGWLGDRFDRTYLIAVFFVGAGASSMIVALSAGPMLLMAALGLLGVFAALYHPIGLALITDIAPRTGRALAVNGVFGNMGLAAAAIVTGFLAAKLGWHSAFFLPGIMSLLIGTVVLWRRIKLGAPSVHETVQSEAASVTATRRTQLAVFAIVCVSALFGGFVFTAVTVSLPKFFEERLVTLAGDLTWIGASTGLVFAVAAFAQLPVGELLDRYGARPILIVLLVAQIGLLVTLAVAHDWLVLPLALLLVTLIFAEIPITSWLLGRHVESGLRSRAVSVEYVLSLGMGSIVVPAIAFMHGVGLGFDVQFHILAASAFAVLVAAWFLPRTRLQRPAVRENVAHERAL